MQPVNIDSKDDNGSGGEWLWSRIESVPEALKEKLLQQAVRTTTSESSDLNPYRRRYCTVL